ncbi:DMT family transporter [Pseudomonas sp. Irchel 3A7]|uniref:DMT family transporter n=1 Tax=Pseudomonas sp. Irchel 3A7 TaxID=2008913 RepID=UPI0014822EB7|nr:DMT family transporter [Pseudomonas sp. Irchel 3A7]
MGISALLLVNALDGAKEVYFGIILQKLDSTVVAFILFAIAWPICFLLHVTNLKSRNGKLQSIKNRKQFHLLLLTLNFSSAALWIAFTFSLKWFEPAIVSALIGGIGIIATLTLIKFIRPSTTLIRADYIATIIIAIASIYLAWISINGHTALEEELDSLQARESYFVMIICGIAMALVSITSKRLADHGVSSLFICAHRFYILLVITGAYSLYNQIELAKALEYIIPLFWLSIFGVILPFYLLQEGIKRCEPVTTQAVLAAAPLFTVAFQSFDSRLEFSEFSLAGVVIICLAAAHNSHSHLKQIKNEETKYQIRGNR